MSGTAAVRALAMTALALVTAGCAATASIVAQAPASSARTPTDALAGEVTVLAAASLGEAFTALADSFEAAHPGVSVTLGLGPSSGLAAQVAAGAPADVLATADTSTMERALAGIAPGDGPDDEPIVFARNTLAVAVPGQDPGDVDDLSDLDRSDVTFAVCAPEVPCGAAAERVLAAAGIGRTPVTYENDATAVLTKVVWEEVDAGLVYASDVRPQAPAVLRGTVRAVPIPQDLNTTTSYPLVALSRTDLARAFVDHVLSAEGTRVLAEAGFLRP